MSKIKHLHFKQTFIKRYLFINQRAYDKQWEVVKLVPDPRFNYDSTWRGGRNAKGRIIKPLTWITHHVLESRSEAMDRANEMVDIIENNA